MKMNKGLMLFAFLTLFFAASIFATMNDVKVVVCNNTNLTEPNCTTWWNTLNLTEANFTYNNLTNYTTMNYTNNITLVYEDNRNQTINETIIHTNHSTIENKTYVTYNYTGNITDLNLSSKYISSSEIDTKISSSLSPYALKTSIPTAASINITAVEELEDSVVMWRWFFVILLMIIIIVVGYLLMGAFSSQ